jgi:hypothetical protein
MLNKEDYDSINILGNRIMSNAFVLDGKPFAIPGFMIKDMALLVGPRKQIPGAHKLISSATSSIKLFVTKLEEMELDSKDNPKLWDIYLTTLKLMRKSLSLDDEYEANAEENPTLTKEGFFKLIEINKQNIDLLNKTDARMILSTISEINRLYGTYGIDIHIAKLRLLFIVLGQLSNYFSNDLFLSIVTESNENIVKTFLERIIELSISDKEASLEYVDDLLTQMIISWRELFIKCNEPFESREQKNSEATLKPELKEKLRDLITKNLEKDIKKG